MPLAAPSTRASPPVLDEEGLIRQHLPLVDYEVADLLRRLPAHVSSQDLVSAGLTALALAARAHDPSHGVPFGRYAARRIAGALLDELRTHDWASRAVRRRAREHDDAAGVLAQQLGRPVTQAELAEHLGVAVADVQAAEHDVHRAVVLSWQSVVEVTGGEPALPSGAPCPEQVLLGRERDAYLRDAVQELPVRLREVMTSLYVDDESVQEVASRLEVTESRVSQLRTEALALLREAMAAALAPERLQDKAVPNQAVEDTALPEGRAARRKAAYHAAVAGRSTWQARLGVPDPRVGQAVGRLG